MRKKGRGKRDGCHSTRGRGGGSGSSNSKKKKRKEKALGGVSRGRGGHRHGLESAHLEMSHTKPLHSECLCIFKASNSWMLIFVEAASQPLTGALLELYGGCWREPGQ